jgi:hypothetical protein
MEDISMICNDCKYWLSKDELTKEQKLEHKVKEGICKYVLEEANEHTAIEDCWKGSGFEPWE